jgi:hypothetical protein
MSISPDLMLKIRQQSAKLVDKRTAEEQSNQAVIAAKTRRITDRIPAIVAQAIADGASHAQVASIVEGEDFACPTWKDRLFNKAPDQSWLKGAAAMVYAWCEESGLQPFIAPYRTAARSETAIIIQWDSQRMQIELPGDQSFVQKLQAVSAQAQAREAAKRARERIMQVRKTIAEMHAEINRVSKDGRTEVLVTTAYSFRAEPELRGDSWTGDVIAYCEGIGLTLRLDTNLDSSCTHIHDTWASKIYASWKAVVKPAAT